MPKRLYLFYIDIHTLEKVFNQVKKVGTKGEKQTVKNHYGCCICITFDNYRFDNKDDARCK